MRGHEFRARLRMVISRLRKVHRVVEMIAGRIGRYGRGHRVVYRSAKFEKTPWMGCLFWFIV